MDSGRAARAAPRNDRTLLFALDECLRANRNFARRFRMIATFKMTARK
jgi:hypothetical protein